MRKSSKPEVKIIWTDFEELARRVAWMMTLAANDVEQWGVGTHDMVCRLKEDDPLRVGEVIPAIAAGIAAGLIREAARKVLKKGLGTKVRSCRMTVAPILTGTTPGIDSTE